MIAREDGIVAPDPIAGGWMGGQPGYSTLPVSTPPKVLADTPPTIGGTGGSLPSGGFMGGQPLRDPNMPSYTPVDPAAKYASAAPTAAPTIGAGNAVPYVTNPETGLPGGGGGPGLSGTMAGIGGDLGSNTYSQNPIGTDAYYRPNPNLWRAEGTSEWGDVGRTPGQIMTYAQDANGRSIRVPYNPNVPITQVHQSANAGDNSTWNNLMAVSAPLMALGMTGAVGGGAGATELGSGLPVSPEAGAGLGVDPSTGLLEGLPDAGGAAAGAAGAGEAAVPGITAEPGTVPATGTPSIPSIPGLSSVIPGLPGGGSGSAPGAQGGGLMNGIASNPVVAAALLAGLLERPNNPLTQPTVDAVTGAIHSGQSLQGIPIPGVTPSFGRAIDTANQNVGAWKPALDESAAFTRTGGAALTGEDTSRYMNPYIEQALDPVARKIREDAALKRQTDAARAGARGAFGTQRNDQLQGLNDRNETLALKDLYGQGYASAYDKALTTAGADKSRALTAGGAFRDLGSSISGLGREDVAGLTTAGGIESLPFSEQLARDQAASGALSGAAGAGARAIGSTGQPSLLTNLAASAGILSNLGLTGRPGTPGVGIPGVGNIPGVGSIPGAGSIPGIGSGDPELSGQVPYAPPDAEIPEFDLGQYF